jgi:hypothetical protein
LYFLNYQKLYQIFLTNVLDVLTAPPTQGESEDEGLTTLALLQDEFGIPNSLESDMSYLWDTGSLGDCKLIFNHSTTTLMELPTGKASLFSLIFETFMSEVLKLENIFQTNLL